MADRDIKPTTTGDQAHEMIRAWVADGDLHCKLNIGSWGDNEPMGWGILLSDVARHVADALYEQHGIEREHTLAAIRAVFNDELNSPSSETRGGFVE